MDAAGNEKSDTNLQKLTMVNYLLICIYVRICLTVNNSINFEKKLGKMFVRFSHGMMT